MAGLDIQPHSRRISGLVVIALSVLAVAAFASGLARQASSSGAAPFPAYQGPGPGDGLLAVGTIPVATPAPDLQVAQTAPVHRLAPKPPEPDAAAPDTIAASPDAAALAPAGAPAVDASATAPEAPPAPTATPAPNATPAPEDPASPADPTV